MEKIRREIRLFLIRNGKLLLQIIGIILFAILIIQTLNNEAKENKANQENNKLIHEEKKEVNKKIKQDKKIIEEFINCCNDEKIEDAYKMISDYCIKEKYPTIKDFKEKYINQIFDIKICEYEISKINDIYLVELTQNFLETGTKESLKQTKIQIIEGEFENTLYICE